MNALTGAYVSAIVMFVLSIIMYITFRDYVIVGENGIYGEGIFTPWENVKRWGWDRTRGDLVLLTKERGKGQNTFTIRAGKTHMEEINQTIRRYKLNKGKEDKNQEMDIDSAK